MAKSEGANGEIVNKEFTDKTSFGVMEKFEEIKDDKLVYTEPFTKACIDLVNTEALLGTTFTLCKKDMMGNINKIIDRFKTDPKQYETLNAMLEEDSHAIKKPTHIAIAVIWLKRALEFTLAFITALCEDYHNGVEDENLRQILMNSYERTLKQYHGSVTRMLFSSLSRLAPNRRDVHKAWMIHEDCRVDMLYGDLELYVPNFSAVVTVLEELLNYYGLNSTEKVN